MSQQDDRLYSVQAQINHLNNVKKALREREKNLNARSQFLNNPQTFPVNSVKNLRDSLMGSLPAYMMPGNVGGINEVTWPFFFQINLDAGQNPVIIDKNFFKGSF